MNNTNCGIPSNKIKFLTDKLNFPSRNLRYSRRLSIIKKAKYPFSIKKALKKEKNGLAAVFLLFWAFNFIGEMIKLQAIRFEYDF